MNGEAGNIGGQLHLGGYLGARLKRKKKIKKLDKAEFMQEFRAHMQQHKRLQQEAKQLGLSLSQLEAKMEKLIWQRFLLKQINRVDYDRRS